MRYRALNEKITDDGSESGRIGKVLLWVGAGLGGFLALMGFLSISFGGVFNGTIRVALWLLAVYAIIGAITALAVCLRSAGSRKQRAA